MLKKIATIIYWTIIVIAIAFFVVSIADVLINNLSTNPTYHSWNIITKYIDLAIK